MVRAKIKLARIAAENVGSDEPAAGANIAEVLVLTVGGSFAVGSVLGHVDGSHSLMLGWTGHTVHAGGVVCGARFAHPDVVRLIDLKSAELAEEVAWILLIHFREFKLFLAAIVAGKIVDFRFWLLNSFHLRLWDEFDFGIRDNFGRLADRHFVHALDQVVFCQLNLVGLNFEQFAL